MLYTIMKMFQNMRLIKKKSRHYVELSNIVTASLCILPVQQHHLTVPPSMQLMSLDIEHATGSYDAIHSHEVQRIYTDMPTTKYGKKFAMRRLEYLKDLDTRAYFIMKKQGFNCHTPPVIRY
jgi:hypothetical protein